MSVRKCLKCQNDFESEGPHNRLCVSCNQDNKKYPDPTVNRGNRVLRKPLDLSTETTTAQQISGAMWQ